MAELNTEITNIFQEARKDLYYPPLKLEYADVPSIQMDFKSGKYTILVNKDIMKIFSKNAIKGLFHHELNHWVKHPYNLKTIIMEQSMIEEENHEKANLIRNLYDDVVVTLDLIVNKCLDDILEFYREFESQSQLDSLLRTFFEDITGLNFYPGNLKSELRERIQRLRRIDFLDTSRTRIRKNIKEFVEIIGDLIEGFRVPFSFFGIHDFPEEQVERALLEIAEESDFDEFRKVADTTGRWIGIAKGEKSSYQFERPDISWYLSRASRYVVYIKPLSKEGSMYPDEIKDFEIDDSVDSYSAIDSYGKILPGIARKYTMREFEGYSENPVPDAVIVMDSSGSMRNPDTEVSHAVIGAFAIARNYLENGAKVGVINFSGRNIELRPSTDVRKIYETLKIYQGYGTTLHLDELEKYVWEVDAEDYILISDTGIQNLNEILEFFSKLKRRITVIWVKSDVKNYEEFRRCWEAFRNRLPPSTTFIEVEREEDIPGIVVGKAFREIYA
ncbi:MAG TPA: hypothetical protein EYP30_06105 [Archaeoglobaceae archaeon]|nr:hypothetical protein [Archaeoglobaceae archaeon]